MVHKHLIIRAEVEKPLIEIIDGTNWLLKLVEKIGMDITPHGGPHVDYVDKDGNEGLAGIVMIQTSHCSIHVWHKNDPPLAQIDVYSCAEYDIKDVLGHLKEMEPTKIDFKVLDRANKIKSVVGAVVTIPKGTIPKETEDE